MARCTSSRYVIQASRFQSAGSEPEAMRGRSAGKGHQDNENLQCRAFSSSMCGGPRNACTEANHPCIAFKLHVRPDWSQVETSRHIHPAGCTSTCLTPPTAASLESGVPDGVYAGTHTTSYSGLRLYTTTCALLTVRLLLPAHAWGPALPEGTCTQRLSLVPATHADTLLGQEPLPAPAADDNCQPSYLRAQPCTITPSSLYMHAGVPLLYTAPCRGQWNWLTGPSSPAL